MKVRPITSFLPGDLPQIFMTLAVFVLPVAIFFLPAWGNIVVSIFEKNIQVEMFETSRKCRQLKVECLSPTFTIRIH